MSELTDEFGIPLHSPKGNMDDSIRAWNRYPAERAKAKVAPHITQNLIEQATKDFLNGGGQIRQLHHLPHRIEAERYEANRESGILADPLLVLEERDGLSQG